MLNPGLSSCWEKSASISPVTTGNKDFITDLADLPSPSDRERAEIDCKHPGTKTDPVVNQEALDTATVNFDLSLHQGPLSFTAG